MTGSSSAAPAPPPAASPGDRLDSWKEIAAYFNRDKRTVQRWERQEGMPVHRHLHDKQGTVYGIRSELEEWWKGRRARIEREEQDKNANVLSWPAPADAIRTPVPASVATRYEVTGEMGSGGMGVVYKARDRETGEVVGLKVLREELTNNPEWMEKFKEELRLARRITHKNVCRIHEFVRTEDRAYISMEFVDGDTLRQILNRFGALNARTAVRIAEQICAGLAEAHEQGVVHRDLKPENIMLDRYGQIKVMDFGVAARLGKNQEDGEKILGTPGYTAPEQYEGGAADERTDVYAAGLILYEMATGRPAFARETPVEVALKQVREIPAKPRSLERGIPERVERTIIRALEESPEARFQTAQEMAEALKNEIEAQAVLAPAETQELLQHVAGAKWRRWDWALLGLGVAGAIAFFLLITKVRPFSTYRLEMSRDQALGQAEGLVRAYAPELRRGKYFVRFDAGLQMMGLPEFAERNGARQALDSAREHARSWSVSVVQGEKPEQAFTPFSSQFDFDVHGNLLSLRLEGTPAKPGTHDEAEAGRTRSEDLLQGLFDVSPGGTFRRKVAASADGPTWVRENGEKVEPPQPGDVAEEWFWKDAGGKEQGVRLWFAGSKLRSAEKLLGGNDLPLEGKPPKQGLLIAIGDFLLGATCVTLALIYLIKRFYRRNARTHLVLALAMAVSFAVFIAVSPDTDYPTLNGQPSRSNARVLPDLGADLVIAFIIFGTFYILLAVPYHVTASFLPDKITTVEVLCKGKFRSRYVGLALTRGALYGAVFSGASILLLFEQRRGTLRGFQMLSGQLLTGSATAGGVCAFTSILGGSIFTVFLGAMFYALALRYWRRRWLAVLATAIVIGLCAVGVNEGETVPLFAAVVWTLGEGIFIGTVLASNDLLTCWMAWFTYQVFAFAFPVSQVFGNTNPVISSIGLVFWSILFAAGVLVYGWSLLRPSLGPMGRFMEASTP